MIDDARTFWELMERRVAATPDRTMWIDDRDRRFTFEEFATRAERVAAGLSRFGIGEGTVVSWQLPTWVETALLSMALVRLGAIQNPIIPIYREREVGFLLDETSAQWFVVPRVWHGFDYAAMADELTARAVNPCSVLVVDGELPDGDPATLPGPPAPTAPEDAPLRWIYSTSGTTSRPKGVRHTDATLLAGGLGLADALEPDPDDVVSLAFPFAHIGGPDLLVCVLACGITVVSSEAFVPAAALAQFRRHGVTIAGGSTAFYLAFLAEQRKAPGTTLVPSLRYLCGGGAPKPPEVFFEVQREMGIKVVHGYGMTECPMITQGRPGDTDEQLAYTEGAPVRGCEVKIAAPDGSPAPTGTEGEICVRGPMLFKGYTDPTLDTDAFDDEGWFRTGDLGCLRDDGHVVITGRTKDLIIRKGENISAREVEDVLYEHPAVRAVAVIGLPDRERGERVCAVVELVEPDARFGFAEMREHCRRAGLSDRKIPEQLEIVEELPRNATLKVLKYELRDRFSDRG